MVEWILQIRNSHIPRTLLLLVARLCTGWLFKFWVTASCRERGTKDDDYHSRAIGLRSNSISYSVLSAVHTLRCTDHVMCSHTCYNNTSFPSGLGVLCVQRWYRLYNYVQLLQLVLPIILVLSTFFLQTGRTSLPKNSSVYIQSKK
ncbi:uncharacterized protein EDB93DRAFT_503007 [Suillus bovinus]|uniref:uncharacterized protein n=1 Tax=Suillus bovinus TaxID=48563 RepID=UPI001B85BB96|nr:uncharacterized protein EDB93DRAFT_503007 [Suillus bovinus]KAG2145406.1 hypothetical protein EDB93DRAFT_503007 [Suillus bovinus]